MTKRYNNLHREKYKIREIFLGGVKQNTTMNSMLKYLIMITLMYYFLKGLIYLLLWQTTKKVQERALAAKAKERADREAQRRIWEDDENDKNDNKWGKYK